MKKPALPKMNIPAIDFKRLAEDFRTLDPKDPGLWPTAPKLVILAALFIGLLAAAWFAGWSGQLDELGMKQRKETELKDDWLAKKKQAVNLDEYRKQLAEIDPGLGERWLDPQGRGEFPLSLGSLAQPAERQRQTVARLD